MKFGSAGAVIEYFDFRIWWFFAQAAAEGLDGRFLGSESPGQKENPVAALVENIAFARTEEAVDKTFPEPLDIFLYPSDFDDINARRKYHQAPSFFIVAQGTQSAGVPQLFEKSIACLYKDRVT
jgi:hypothetical protein